MKMDVQHPRWEEFLGLLAGPEGCDFHSAEDGRTVWSCEHGVDLPICERLLRQMGFGDFEVLMSLVYFYAHGGTCDCEVVLTVQDARR